jgi:hypothetical protein
LQAFTKVAEDQEAPVTPKEMVFETIKSDLSLGQRNKETLQNPIH